MPPANSDSTLTKSSQIEGAVTIDVPQDSENANSPDDDHDANASRTQTETGRSQPEPFDNELLRRAVNDVGRWAYGIILVEVWVMNSDNTALYRPENGWWIDPVYHNACAADCLICRLTEPNRDDYLPAHPLAPGEGLPGALWSEASNSFHVSRGSSLRRGLLSPNRPNIQHHYPDVSPRSTVVWRDIKALSSDPDQPWNPRLQALSEVGLGWAAAVPFNYHGQQGIVVYVARKQVDQRHLQSVENEAYLVSASDLIGAAFALRGPRSLVVNSRRVEVDRTIRRLRVFILSLIRLGISLEDHVAQVHSENRTESDSVVETHRYRCTNKCTTKSLQKFAVATIKKTRGGGVKPPPTFTVAQSLQSFMGAFVTLLCVCRLNVYLQREFGSDYSVVLGPFGAFATLLYGLTAAPASQPRNAMIGQLVSLSIAMGISNISADLWIRQALATSLSIACMVKLGVTHPPAGAAALIFSSGTLRWTHVATMLIGNVVAISTATLLNNLSNQRQYPTFWGLDFLPERSTEKIARKD